MSYFTPEAYQAAAATGAIFFDWELNPVQPQVGEWYCEFELTIPEDGRFPAYVQDEALVEYLGVEARQVMGESGPIERGAHIVSEEDGDCREPRTSVLVRQR